MAGTAVAIGHVQKAALPLHVQQLNQLLNISPLLKHIEKVFADIENDRKRRYICVYVCLTCRKSTCTNTVGGRESWRTLGRVMYSVAVRVDTCTV